jgi:putative adhesin
VTRGLWRVGGSVLTVAVLGMGTANVVAQISFDSRSFTRVVTTPVRVVDAHVGTGDITVTAVPGSDRVVVRATVQRGLMDTHESVTVRGDRVEIHTSCPPLLSEHCKGIFRVEVPPDVDVVAHAGGHVTVTGTHGSVDAKASQGSITLTDLTGALRAHSSQGSVHATGLGSADVEASSSQGDVGLAFVRAPERVDVHSSQGDVEVVLPGDGTAYRVDVGASQGSTHVRVPTDPNGTRHISAHSSQGDVTVSTG